MPMVIISLREGTPPEYRRAIADSIHHAMMQTLGIPADDRFQLVLEHAPENMIHDRMFFGIERSVRSVFVQITINQRDASVKRELFARIADNLTTSPGVRREDVFIGIVEVAPENWWAHARPPGTGAPGRGETAG
jgi:phenylpyruvate tautomerase PptA (4-oxalocrotonate tautomerase family)